MRYGGPGSLVHGEVGAWNRSADRVAQDGGCAEQASGGLMETRGGRVLGAALQRKGDAVPVFDFAPDGEAAQQTLARLIRLPGSNQRSPQIMERGGLDDAIAQFAVDGQRLLI